MADMKERRANLFGLPTAQGPSQEVIDLLRIVNEAHKANAELVEALRETTKQLNEPEDDSEEQELRGQLQSCQAMLLAETDARARLAGEVDALRSTLAQIQIPAPIAPTPIDVQAIAQAVIASLPAAPAPVAQPRPKFLILETKDSMGNPRKVRVTPEY